MSEDVKKINWILILILCLFVFNAFLYMYAKPLWFDEAFSLETVHAMNEGKVIDWRHYDVHPNTYYVALEKWMQVPHAGISETYWARMLSIVFGVIFLYIVYESTKNLFEGEEKALFVVAMMAVCSTYVYFAAEARQYMLLLMVAASAVFWLSVQVKNGFSWWRTVLIGGLCFALPLIHYYAGMFFIVMTGMYFIFMWKKASKKEVMGATAIIFLCGLLGIVLALTIAIPQMLQGSFMWFHTSTFVSLPSSLLFMFVQVEGVPMANWIAQILFIVFCSIMIYLFLWKLLFKTVKKGMTEKQKYWTVFMIAGLAPFAGLVLKIVLSGVFPQLFHHRFFLVVGWMFAVACFVTLAEYYQKSSVRGAVLILIIFVTLIVSLVSGMLNAPFQELEELTYILPCGGVTVVHQSPFSGLPAKVMDRERGCDNRHVFVTYLEPNQRHTAGYDVVPTEEIYFNDELPEDSFFYFLPDSEGEVFYRNGTYTHSFDGNEAREAGIEIKDLDGISLWYFAESGVQMDVRIELG